jgi:hypothetical protein
MCLFNPICNYPTLITTFITHYAFLFKGLIIMTTTTNSWVTNGRLTKVMGFVLSLMAGMVGGGLVFGMGWWLGKEAGVLSQLVDVFNLTAQTPWYLSRSGGTVGYLLLAGSTIWGLLLSSKIIKETLPAALSLAMHNILSWLAIAFTGVHMAALLFDNYFTYTLGDLLVPFIGPYEPGWVGLGVIGFYLMLLTTISFYFRKQIGQKRWRSLHYLTFGVYALCTIHGAMAGTDSGNLGMQVMYWGSGMLVFFLTANRMLVGKGGN